MKKVFISFSSNDQSFALNMVDFLENSGIPCFICSRDIQKGHDYASALVEAIDDCEYFVLICSRSSDRSEHVRNEIQQAVNKNKTIIPYKIEDFVLSNCVNYYLARKQFINAFELEEQAGLDLLVNSIKNDAGTKFDVLIGNLPELQIDKGKNYTREQIAEDLLNKSQKYSHSLYKTIFRKNPEKRAEFQKKSNLFYKKAFTIYGRGKEIETDDIVSVIIDKAEDTDNETIFTIYAPAGTGKNHLMQSIFYRMMDRFIAKESDIIPVYVPFGYFSRECDVESLNNAEPRMFELLKTEYAEVINFCSNNPNITAFLLYDSLRDYNVSVIPPEKAAPKIFGALPNVKIGAAVDTGLCRNQMRTKTGFACLRGTPYFNIESNRIFIFDEEKCLDYLESVCDLYDFGCSSKEIYDVAKSKGFLWLDPTIVELILEAIENRLSNNTTMADIYENEVVSMLDNDFKSLKSIALKSYRFASTNDEFDDEYADDQWLVLSKHNTFSSYLIAYHIRTTLEEYETTKNIEPLLRFYPSLIVSFVDDYLEKNASLQRAVVKIINERYQELDDMHRARLIFWAAHVKNENLRNEICEFVLNELKRVSPLVINSRLDGDDISEGNRCLQILYRILSQTALEFGKTSYIDDFLCNLLISDQANSMNKGYLLFYYGDIHADFTEVSMHFADRPELGLRTINKLDDILHYELIETNSNRPVELFLFSFFSLLQTRIECGSADVEDIDLVEMCKNAIKYYTHYKRKQSVITSRKIKFYFEGICEDFKEFIESKQKINIACSILNPMLDPELTPRANWQRVKTKRVETVAEHLYGAFLIGLVLLPQRDPSQEGYSKKEILDMLLLHDLGEVKVGDHDILASDQEKMFYDTQEDAAIRTLFEKGTYTQIANLSIYYSQWSTFQNAMDINAKIAHDIDVIHTIYRFSLYYVASEENFNEKEIDAFLNYREQIMTEVGWKIYNSVVRDNPSFNSIKDKLEL